ncbi:zinc ribbon domain-containing protein [Nocardioides coralli]|uniref:zinc ribbon domain-containing protein n=1 Tax=Nocardioides coralli TaxID=2872154 RepID=UPI003D29C1AB
MLDLQELDARADQLRHQRRTLPELADIEAQQKSRAELDGQLVDAQMTVDDLETERAKIDADVEQARARKTRDQEKIDQGLVSNPKDLQRMLHELESLDRRITTLEDQELEVMEQLEEAQRTLDSLMVEVTATDERIASLTTSRDEKTAAIDTDLAGVEADRAPTVDGLPEDLLKLYDRLRDQKGGIGAAALRARQCGGCRLTLDAAELATIRSAASDEVIRCEECQRILVRTAESGL